MSSSSFFVCAMRPRGCFVVRRAGFEAAVQDADLSVGELSQSCVVFCSARPLAVVVGAGSRRGFESGEGLRHERVDEPVLVHEPGGYDSLLARGSGDRAGAGVVLAERRPRMKKCSPAGCYRTRVCPKAASLTLIRMFPRGQSSSRTMVRFGPVRPTSVNPAARKVLSTPW